MANGPEGGDRETPLQRRIRAAKNFILRLLGDIDANTDKNKHQKDLEKANEATKKRQELERLISEAERAPSDPDIKKSRQENVEVAMHELVELIKHKVYPHVPEITETVLTALLVEELGPAAPAVAKVVTELITSPEFLSHAGRTADQIKANLRAYAARLRRRGQGNIADKIEHQINQDDAARPPEGPGGPENPPPDTPEHGRGGNRGNDGEEREPIETYLDRYYQKKKRDRSRGLPANAGATDTGEIEKWLDILEDQSNYVGLSSELQRSLLGGAIMRQIQLTRRQQVILRAFDGAEEFKAYFRAMQHMKADEQGVQRSQVTINAVYKEISNDVKEVVRELLSALSGTVDKSSQKETQYIDLIAERISRNISREIAGDTEMDIPGGVELADTDAFLPSEAQTPSTRKGNELLIGGMNDYLVPRTVRVSLSEALIDDLTTTIAKLQKITVGFHNARTFAYSGGSHKDFSEQVKRDGVKPADLVWAFKKEDDVNLAYNLLVQSLEQLKAQTARTITERYGAMSKVGGLTEAEYRAWIQLLSLDDNYRNAEISHREVQKAAEEAKERGGEESAEAYRELKKKERLYKKTMDRIRQRKLRAIKMASGIMWGHTKEGWGIMLDAYLLTKRVELGKDEYTVGQHYGGSQAGGLEKMVGELHPHLTDDRWGRDKLAPIWMLYQPRDLDGASGPWARDDAYTHTRLYDLYDQHQRAFYTGRSDELADFDDNYITVHEFANYSFLDMLKREGWRLRQYELYKEKYDQEAQTLGKSGFTKHEYVIKRLMMRGGPRLVKMYIDHNLGDMMQHDRSMSRHARTYANAEKVKAVETKTGDEFPWQASALAKGREAETAGKEAYYARFIFDDIAKRFTTSLIALEQPRYMPENEGTLYTGLNQYVERLPIFQNLPPSVLQTEIYPVFIDALHTIERNKWERYYRDPKVTEAERIRRQVDEAPQDIALQDFEDAEVKKILELHYKLNQERIGKITENKYELTATFDEYYAALKGFHNRLKSERDKARYNRTSRFKGRRQSLSERYAHMLALDQGGVNQALGGSYFDFTLEIQQGGSEALNRLGGDAAKAAEMSEAWHKLTGDGGALESFAQGAFQDEDELKTGAKGIADAIAEVVKFPYEAISPDTGNMYKVRHEVFWARAFATPEAFRGLFGKFGETLWKDFTGKAQTNLFAEYYQKVFGRTDVTALDSDQLRTVLNVWEKELRVPPRKFEVSNYQNPKDMNVIRRSIRGAEDSLRHLSAIGRLPIIRNIPVVRSIPGAIGSTLRGTLRTLTSPITEPYGKSYKAHGFHQGMVLKELGARKRDILKEKLISVDSILLLLGLIGGLYEAASEKVNEDSK